MKRHATGQGSPVQVRSFGRTSLPLRELPPDVQRCDQDRPQGEAEGQVRSHRDGLSPTEGVRSSHPLHPVGLRGSVLVYRNKDRKSDPYIEKAFLKLDNQSYSLNHLHLRIPTTPRRFFYLTLKGSDYHLSFIDDPALKRRSFTLTGRTVSIAFSKEIAAIETLGEVGIDVNERNVTASDTSGDSVVFDTSNVAELKERYRVIRAKIGEGRGGTSDKPQT